MTTDMRSRARGSDAWDAAGTVYRRKDGDASRDDAARAIKHGAIAGVLRDWGYGTIEWVDVPIDCQRLDPARQFVDELAAELAGTSPNGSEILRSIWVDLQTQERMVLVEAVF